MTLENLANIVEILGVIAIVCGIGFGLVQLKQHRIQRRDLAIVECARSFEDSEFTEAYRLLSSLKGQQSKSQLKSLGDEYEVAALRIGMKFETVGLLVFKGVVPMDAIEDLVGGIALNLWHTLGPWIEETRSDQSYPRFWEWYQWLVDRLKERGKEQRLPAYEAYANWKQSPR